MDPNIALPAVGAAPEHLSTVALFLRADPIVKGVVLLLVLASVAVWAIILDKVVRLRRIRSQADVFRRQVQAKSPAHGEATANGLNGAIVFAGSREANEPGDGTPESRAERRERIERAMRAAVAPELQRLEHGLPFLATVGSSAPFIGLFGTVWGIMNSFQAIAQSQDTSLAVVAPGIAEALFATAIGLVAAIPAVIGYNKITTDLRRASRQFSASIAELGGQLARSGATARKKAAE